MINYEKDTLKYNEVVSLTSNNSQLKIIKKDKDVEWLYKGNNGDDAFVVTMDDSEIFETFLNLYTELENGKLLDDGELESLGTDILESATFHNYQDEVKNSLTYQKIYNDGEITYVSDDVDKTTADSITMTKGDDYIMIKFKGIKPAANRRIKFAFNALNIFSFAKPFLRHADAIANVDLSYHQYNFYDILKKR